MCQQTLTHFQTLATWSRTLGRHRDARETDTSRHSDKFDFHKKHDFPFGANRRMQVPGDGMSNRDSHPQVGFSA
jgi:hypothetical protein